MGRWTLVKKATAALGRTGVFVATSSCSTTLEPTVLGSSEGGDSSAGAAPRDVFTSCVPAQRASSEYFVCPDALAYEAAAHDCRLRGGHLAAMGSSEENAFLAEHARSVLNSNYWIGGTRDDDHVWRWPDGTVFWRGGRDGSPEGDAFVLWEPGEPNNSSTVSDDPERCLALTMENDDWNDRVCSVLLPYICERELTDF